MKKKKEEVEEILEPVEEVLEPVEEINKPSAEFYILKIGETLEDVAKKFGLKADKLKELNGEVYGTNQIKLK